MFKSVSTAELVTATGGTLHLNPSQLQTPKYNIKPPVWPRRVEGSPASTHSNTTTAHVGF